VIFTKNESVRAGCPEGWKASEGNITCGEDDVWKMFQCQKDCFVPALTNGRFNSTISNTVADYNTSIVTGEGLRGVCDKGMIPQGPKVLNCLKNGTLDGVVMCLDPNKGVCPKPPDVDNTTSTLKCYLEGKITRCNMTCLDNHYIVKGTTLSSLQSVYCNSDTKEWSHKSSTNTDYQFDKCTKKEEPAYRVLSAVLTLSGTNTCPTISALHTALAAWLDTQSKLTNSNYACLKVGVTGKAVCSLVDGGDCSTGVDVIDYSFKLNQTLDMANNHIDTVNTQLKSDAAGKKMSLVVTSAKKRATTTLTSQSVVTQVKDTCTAGRASINSVCIACSPGYYATLTSCQLCDFGTYSAVSGAAQCTVCSGSKSTLYVGADSDTFCIDGVCTIPSLFHGTTTPPEGSRVLESTAVSVSCDSGKSLGHHQQSKDIKCSEQSKFSCYGLCGVTEWSSVMNLLPSSGALERGDDIEHGREVTVKCQGSEQTIARSCNNGTRINFPDCTPRLTLPGSTVTSGDRAVLTCTSSVIANSVVVSWYIDGNQVTTGVEQQPYSEGSQVSTLEVLSTTKDLTLTCTVRTPGGVTASETAQLKVVIPEPKGDAVRPNVVFVTLMGAIFISLIVI